MLTELAERLRAGDYAGVETLARTTLVDDPRNPDVRVALGLSLLFLDRPGEAESVFADLARDQPDEPAHWVNLASARRADHRPDEALPAFAHAAQLGEASADFFYNLGLTHLERQDLESARAVLQRAAALAAGDAEIHIALARACHESLRTDEALAALGDWALWPSLGSAQLAEIAFLLMNLGDSAGSEQALARALADPEPGAAASATLVKMLERMNRVDDAVALLQRARRLADSRSEQRDMRLVEAVLAQRAGEHERAAVLYRKALGEPGPFETRHFQLFPLAKSLDALGRHADAFEVLREAHASQQASILQASPATILRGAPTMEITRFGAEAGDVARWQDPDAPPLAESPVFIVAFPRSGTTLLELTLDAHPALLSMDEQPFVQNALDDMIAHGARYPEQLAGLQPRQLQLLRARYYDRVFRRLPQLGAQQRIVDKNPLNMLRLPVIRRLFPNAPIVLAIRHPGDVLLSCYMQHFRAPDFALMCRDLATLALGY